MSQAQNERLLIAIVPNMLKDDLVDSLMTHNDLSGFSLSKIQGFSRAHSHFNLQEQVEGYRDFYRFEVLHQAEDTEVLCDLLSSISAQQNIRYWILPLLDSGVL